MTIWEAFCSPVWRAGYKVQLAAMGKSVVEIDDILSKFQSYIANMKTGHFATALNNAATREDFEMQLHEIFDVKWANYIPDKYRDIPGYFYDYLKYLDSAQAIWGEYFNDEEKTLYDVVDYPEMPVEKLTDYETRFLNTNGKLTCLRNPILLSTIRKGMKNGVIDVAAAARTCKLYYGSLLPGMKISDYKSLLGTIWVRTNEVRRGNGDHKLSVVYPDGTEKVNRVHESLVDVCMFYGPEVVKSKRIMIRNMDLLVKYIPLGQEKEYKELCDGWYINVVGDFKSKYNVIRNINMLLGERLKITTVN